MAKDTPEDSTAIEDDTTSVAETNLPSSTLSETTPSLPVAGPGRPRKVRTYTQEELNSLVRAFLLKSFKKIKIDGYKSDRKRLDTIRTRIVRIIKKIPNLLLVQCHSKGDYKSSDLNNYSRVYKSACLMLKRMLN